MSDSSRCRGRLLAFVVTVLWSSSWVLIRVGLDETELRPLTFAGLRYFLAAFVLTPWILRGTRQRTHTGGGEGLGRWWWAPLVALGVVQYALTQGSQFVAIEAQPAATTSLVLAATPMLVAVGGVFLDEPPRSGHLVGAVLAVVGAVIYFRGDLGASPVGMVAAGVTVFSNAGSVLIGRSVNRQRHLDAGVVTIVSMSIGAVMLLGVGVAVEGIPDLGARSLAILGWLSVVNTAAAFTMWNTALRQLPAIDAAAIQNTMGIQIPLLAWIALDQPLGAAELAGLGCAALGAWVAVSTSQRNDLRRRQ